MQVYLIRNGQGDFRHAADPHTALLSAQGRRQAQRIASLCKTWDIQMLCLSSMLRSQETADAITDKMPELTRWDLDELEDLTTDDLMGDPTASRLTSRWSHEQYVRGLQRMWSRVMPVWTRVQIYAQRRGLERVAFLGHATVLRLLLLNWLGQDWRAIPTGKLCLDHGSSSRLTLDDQHVTVDWINRTIEETH